MSVHNTISLARFCVPPTCVQQAIRKPFHFGKSSYLLQRPCQPHDACVLARMGTWRFRRKNVISERKQPNLKQINKNASTLAQKRLMQIAKQAEQRIEQKILKVQFHSICERNRPLATMALAALIFAGYSPFAVAFDFCFRSLGFARVCGFLLLI